MEMNVYNLRSDVTYLQRHADLLSMRPATIPMREEGTHSPAAQGCARSKAPCIYILKADVNANLKAHVRSTSAFDVEADVDMAAFKDSFMVTMECNLYLPDTHHMHFFL